MAGGSSFSFFAERDIDIFVALEIALFCATVRLDFAEMAGMGEYPSSEEISSASLMPSSSLISTLRASSVLSFSFSSVEDDRRAGGGFFVLAVLFELERFALENANVPCLRGTPFLGLEFFVEVIVESDGSNSRL
jgi:hypothetical protein